MTPTLGNEGELVKAKIGNVTKSQQVYDSQYRTSDFKDGKSQTSHYTFDNVSNLKSLTYQLGDKIQFTNYDADNNLLTRLNGRNTSITYTRATDDSRVTDINYSAPNYYPIHID